MSKPMIQPDAMPKRISVLGSTGSIGDSSLDLVRRNPDSFQIEALTAFTNVDLLAEQVREFNPAMAVIGDADRFAALKDALPDYRGELAAGSEALAEAAARPTDLVIAGIVGAAGLEPTLAAVSQGHTVALANKECLVCAGDLMIHAVRQSGATLLPIDSEHNAIFQVFDFERANGVDHIVLTASGGPFRGMTRQDMSGVTPEQAVAHPNWSMGAKISVDSATMMNKGLEAIEAFHLFPVDVDQIRILVHPQSVIHSMVAYVDGSVLAQLGSPDMRVPIAYAMSWPDRMPTPVTPLDLAEIGKLEFEAPDEVAFPALRLAREALQTGGAAPTILNAANEVAVHGFLQRQIGFLDIARVVEETMQSISRPAPSAISDVIALDQEARAEADRLLGQTAK